MRGRRPFASDLPVTPDVTPSAPRSVRSSRSSDHAPPRGR
jgi:hypothetical protein